MLLVDVTREVLKGLAEQAGITYTEPVGAKYGGNGETIYDIWDPRMRAVDLARTVMYEILGYTWDDARLMEIMEQVQHETVQMKEGPMAVVRTDTLTSEAFDVVAGGKEITVEGYVEKGSTVTAVIQPDSKVEGQVVMAEVDDKGYFKAVVKVGEKRELTVRVEKDGFVKEIVRRWIDPEMWFRHEETVREVVKTRAAGK